MLNLSKSLHVFLFVALTSDFRTDALSDDAVKLVKDWAPIVWLHSEDPFYPSTVEFHLENVQVNDENDVVVQSDPTSTTILTGEETSGYHLNTKETIDCVNCFQPFFSGESLDDVPVYTFVTEHSDACSTIDVSYRFFYPYNYGKDVCVGLEEFGICLGSVRTFGNHVGDWEHLSLRIQNGEPVEAYLGVHSFGAWYTWDRNSSRFEFSEGEPLRMETEEDNLDIDLPETRIEVEYPRYLDLEDGRIAVFSANGSHGTWAQPGKHTYLHILTVHLDDFTERGSRWNTWQNINIYEMGNTFTGTNSSWLEFQGRWGNTHKLECDLEPLFGECGLVSGPGGPSGWKSDHDFEQPPVCES